MSSNIPTVAFWDPTYFEIRDDFKYIYDLLSECKIIHDNPDSASDFDMVYSDISSWWTHPSVQSARMEFCRFHAYKSKTWIRDWSSLLRSLSH